jgi:hypothetical protein
MLAYHYALISNPCERTVRDLLDYVRTHPGRLHVLEPADSRAMQCAVATASLDNDDEYAGEAEEFLLELSQPALH